MQRYNISRDGDLMKAENGYVYLASDVDAFMTAAGLKNWATQANRVADLEKAIQGARELMRELWRAEGNVSDELAARCKGFMGGG